MRKRIFKLVVKFGLLVAALCVATVVALWLFFPEEKIRTALERELSRKLDQIVAIDSVSIGFYPDLEFVAWDVTIVDPRTSQRLVSAQKVRLDLDTRELLNKRYIVENIVVTAPELEFDRDITGKWNVEDLIGRLGSSEPPTKEETAKTSPETEIGPIAIRQGVLHVHDKKSGIRVEVSKARATVDLNNDLIRFDSASISLPAVQAKTSGTLSHLSDSNPVLDFETDVRVEKEGPLRNFGPALISKKATIVELSGSVSGRLDSLTIKSSFSMNRLATAGIATRGNVKGTLKTNKNVFEISSLDALFGRSKASLSGVVNDIGSSGRKISLEGRVRFMLEDAQAIPGVEALERLEPAGAVTGPVSVVAIEKRFDVKGDLNLKEAEITFPKLMRKQRGAPASLSFDVRYVMPAELIVNDLELLVAGAEVAGKGRAAPASTPWLQASVTTSDFPLQILDQLPSASFEKGSLALAVDVEQARPEDGRITHTGKAAIAKATVELDALREPFRELNANVTWDNQKAVADSVSFLFAGSSHVGHAQISNFANPRLVGEVHTDSLNVRAITAAVGREKSRDDEPASAEGPGMSIELNVEADSMDAAGLKTGPLTTTWKGSADSHSFSPFQIQVFGGALSGTSELKPSEEGLRWTAQFEGKDMSLETVIAEFHKGSTKGSGLVNVNGNISGMATGGKENVLRSLGGNLRIAVREGEIMEYSLLKDILLLTQVPVGPSLIPGLREVVGVSTLLDVAKTAGRTLDPTRVSFHKIDGSFSVAGGVAHTKDLRFESGTVDLICKGDMDLAKNIMDMKIRATPLGFVGSLMGKAPIVGGVLKGTKEAILSTDFVARGPIAHPDVKLAAVDKLLPGKK